MDLSPNSEPYDRAQADHAAIVEALEADDVRIAIPHTFGHGRGVQVMRKSKKVGPVILRSEGQDLAELLWMVGKIAEPGDTPMPSHLRELVREAIDTAPVDHIVTKTTAAELTDHIVARLEAAIAEPVAGPQEEEGMSDTHTSPEVAPPTEPGWYAYDGGAQTMVFYLHSDADVEAGHSRWDVHTSDGMAHRCEWGYIEQALGVWNLVPLIPADYRALGEDVTSHSMLRGFTHFDQRMCYYHSRLGKWVCGHPVDDPETGPESRWVIDRECLREHPDLSDPSARERD